MSATIVAPATERAPRHTKPMIHAFPEGSLIALCGRTRKNTGNVSATGKDRCPVCLLEAGRKSFVGR